jgi:hypothetical protein
MTNASISGVFQVGLHTSLGNCDMRPEQSCRVGPTISSQTIAKYHDMADLWKGPLNLCRPKKNSR